MARKLGAFCGGGVGVGAASCHAWGRESIPTLDPSLYWNMATQSQYHATLRGGVKLRNVGADAQKKNQKSYLVP